MIDILMATYNGERFIGEQLKSIGNQTYKDWQLIIRDDCSEDKTCEIITDFMKDFPGKVKLYKNQRPSGGAKDNFLKMIQDIEHDYVMFADQDDVWLPDKVETSMSHMQKMEKDSDRDVPVLVYTDLMVVNENLEVLSPSFSRMMNLPVEVNLNREMVQNCVTGCTVMINKPMVDALGLIHNFDRILMHDHFLALIAECFGKTHRIDRATIKYRQHGSNSVGASDSRSPIYLWGRLRRGRRKFRMDMERSMDQVAYFLEVFGKDISDSRKKSLLSGYAELKGKSKIKKIIFCIKNGVLKKGMIRKVMQLLWM